MSKKSSLNSPIELFVLLVVSVTFLTALGFAADHSLGSEISTRGNLYFFLAGVLIVCGSVAFVVFGLDRFRKSKRRRS